MALHVPKAPGVSQMLKDGARLYSGLEESVFRNISACQEFAKTLRSAYGPCGMNKLVINHIKKQFLTSDAATIMRELEVEHPAVKLMIMSSKMQDAEIGDGTNFVVILAAALLGSAEELLRLGLIANDVIEGYECALQKCIEIMPSLCCSNVDDVLNPEYVRNAIRASIMSKQFGNEDFLADLVTKACISVAKSNAAAPDSKTIVSFNVDNIRVVKIIGSGLQSSQIVQGMVFRSEAESYVKKVDNAKIVVFNCAVDITQTESKGNVLIKSADELMNFNRGEEDLLEKQIAALAEAGVNVVVAGAKFGAIALHYMNKYKLMAVRLNSKFELRRLSQTVKATVFARICVPTKEELGFCSRVYSDEIGETKVIVFKQHENESKITTIVVRGSTMNSMDDVERAIDDGVNSYKVLTRDSRLLAGAGAFEIEMCTKLKKYAETLSDLQQYAVEKFATVFEQFPKIIAENCGRNGNEVLDELYRQHNDEKKPYSGVNVDLDSAVLTCDAKQQNYYDLYLGKMWAIRYAVIAAVTVLRIDQIIMAKKAGGPQARNAAQSDDEC